VSQNVSVSEFEYLGVPVSQGASILEYECLGMRVSWSASPLECECLGVQVSRSAIVSWCECLAVPVSRNASASECEGLYSQVVYSQLHANSDKTKLSNSEQAILVCVFVCRHCQYSFRSKNFYICIRIYMNLQTIYQNNDRSPRG